MTPTRRGTHNAIGTPGGLLFHGTARDRLASIRRDGLQPRIPEYDDRVPWEAVYLTEDLDQAWANGIKWTDSRDRSVVLIVDVSGLPLLIDGWVTCPCPIEPERISVWGEPPHGRLGEARLRADWFKFGNVLARLAGG